MIIPGNQYVTGGALPRRQACGENVRHSKLSLLEKRVRPMRSSATIN